MVLKHASTRLYKSVVDIWILRICTQIPRTCECMTSHSKISFAHVSKLRTIQWNPKGLYEQKREHEGQRRWCVDASRVRSLLERPPAEDLSTSRSWRGWGELDSPSSPEKQHDPWLSQWGPAKEPEVGSKAGQRAQRESLLNNREQN